MNNIDILDSSKVEFINELSSSFSELANNIFSKAEEICKNDNRFNKLTEKEQVDQIINTIFNNSEVIAQEIYLIVETSLYLKKIDPETIGKDLFATGKTIKGHSYFAKNPLGVTTSLNAAIINSKELGTVFNLTSSVLEQFGETDLEISMVINKHIEFLYQFQFVPDSKEADRLKEKLKLNLDNLFKLQDRLQEIFKDSCQKLKIVEKNLLIRNENEDKLTIVNKFKGIEEELNEILRKQRDTINRIKAITLKPAQNLEELEKLINQFSTYLVSYPISRSFLVFANNSKISGEQIKRISTLEERFIGNYKLFLEEAKKMMSRNIPDLNERKAFIKNFLINVRNNMDKPSYDNLTDFMNLLI